MPRERVGAATRRKFAQLEPQCSRTRDSRRTHNVLVVEDDEAVRESTAAILRSEGFQVLEAADAAAATWTLASEDIDVLLLDLQLCRQDGTVVLDALEKGSTAVVFSAFGFFEEPDIRQRFGPIVFECLRKPVPPSRLIEVVSAAAAHARDEGHEPRVKPIAPRMALRLAMAGLSRMTPQSEQEERDRALDVGTAPGGESSSERPE